MNNIHSNALRDMAEVIDGTNRGAAILQRAFDAGIASAVQRLAAHIGCPPYGQDPFAWEGMERAVRGPRLAYSVDTWAKWLAAGPSARDSAVMDEAEEDGPLIKDEDE
ncbi:hypothetical protein SAMN04488581_2646 [Mycolicibacterium neoaurum]|uniref:hypothetical protein n=1 Tax=Mycolicibacterium neoaurum TaxID=1795 RepID=UPI00055E891D|nr:hypothetical protein [Mycolicibacterium neoaurum]SDD60518.1 hypothetical protein SAMN04488581_2646 [Mycolicibacterium neoaurum]